MIEAAPTRMLERGEQADLPPALLLQGAVDDALPRMIGESFVEACGLAGGVIEMGKYPGAGHGFIREGGPQAEGALRQIRSFIERHLQSD